MSTELSEHDKQLVEYLNEAGAAGAQFGVTRYLHGIYSSRTDLREAFPDLDRDGAAFIEWVHACGRAEVPIIDELLPPVPDEFRHFVPGTGASAQPSATIRGTGVNLVGFLRAELGLGEAGRLLVKALDARRVPLLPIEGTVRPSTRHGHSFGALPPAAAGFPVNLISTNPEGLNMLVGEVGRRFFEDRFSIGYWWWETDGPLPFEWRANFDLLDEVWVATQYVADCLAPQLTMPVFAMKLPVEVPPVERLSRERLGLPDGFLFLFIFDFASTLQRKNPTGVIEAFRSAFTPGEAAALAIKCINSQVDPKGYERLLAAAGERPDIRVIDRFVSAAEKDAMIASCDCYVSLHRAEGFGLPLAEAMYMGKPVVATGYSGNLDFMTAENSHLVAYTIAPVGEGAWPYPPTGSWAEPEAAHAAALMRRVFDDPEGSRALGARAASDLRRTHSLRAAGVVMERRLDEIAEQLEARLRTPDAQLPGAGAAADLIARGPMPPARSSLGPLGPPLRRLLLRGLKPFTVHQRQVDEQLVAVLARADAEAHEAATRIRELELRLAQVKAAELRELRTARGRQEATNGAADASSNGHRSSNGKDGSRADHRAQELRDQVRSVPFWWHSIDLGHGVVTPGKKGDMTAELVSLRLPELTGREVLDIGAWDGYYSFEAERRGARRVVALDHFVWSIALESRDDALVSRAAEITATDAWQPDRLPGKRGFDLAHAALGSRVEPVVADFMTVDLDALGSFDVVLFLGVLYHMEEPLRALRRLAAVTRELAIVETEAVFVPGYEDRAICEFFSADQLGGDYTNWWAPNLRAVHELLNAAGFARTETVSGAQPSDGGTGPGYNLRVVVHAYK